MTFLEKAFYNSFFSFLRKIYDKYPQQLFWLIVGGLFLLMILIHGDYCLTNDEPIHQAHGEVVWSYFQGNDTLATLSPIDSTGNLVKTFSTKKNENFRGMNFFGGFFDLVVNIFHSPFTNWNTYDFRHLINSIFGLLIMIFIGLTTKELTNWKIAILALLMAALSPRLFGHSFANPKDIPFATLFIMGIHQIVVLLKNLPKFKFLNLIFLTIIIGISIAIRVSGLLVIGFIWISVFAWYLNEIITKKKFDLLLTIKLLISILIVSTLGYLNTLIFWPFAAKDWLGPIKVLIEVSNFNVFNSYEIFKGNWYNAWEIPISYIPTWIWISVPLFINVGIIISGIVYLKKFRGNINLLIYSLLLFFTLFPILYIIAKGSNIYNGIRHLLFVFPTIIIISAISWNQLLVGLRKSSFYYASITILILTMVQPFVWSIKAHPYEAMYFSPVTGGNLAIMKNYETDYWGISTKEAVEWIAKNTEQERKDKVVGIKMYYGDREKVENYSKGYANLVFVPGNNEAGWDYEIVYLASAKFNKSIRFNWPPVNTVYEVKANGLPLAAIVKNKYTGLNTEEIAEKYPTEENYIKLSLEKYGQGNYIAAYIASNKAFNINNKSSFALNNMGASANAMQLYEIAEEKLSLCIQMNPTFNLALNNLNVAREGLKTNRNTSDLLALSVMAYRIGEYEMTINYSKIIIKNEPNNAMAWNNLGSAYNALQNYDEGAIACKKALSIDPDFQLAKNNLNYALSYLNQ